MKHLYLFFVFISLFSCSEVSVEDAEEKPDMYFPQNNSDQWESISTNDLGWDQDVLNELYTFLEDNNTRAFILLKDGKIAVESYWGKNILNIASFGQSSNWYWASAGKSLTSVLVGIAQQKGFLSVNDKTSDYLGVGWTSLATEKENKITIKHQLTMTTGLDHQIDDWDCTLPECLNYGVDAGEQWFYHNAPYTLLEQVVEVATEMDYNQFTTDYMGQKIGMYGNWVKSGYNNVFWSTPREAARFGLLIQNKGIWNGVEVLNDMTYYDAMLNSSQSLNPSYGYLWWLNGKGSVVLPGFSVAVPRDMCPNAPSDLMAAMGKNGQFIEVLPEEGIVVVRMGEAPDDSLLPVLFHDDMWQILMRLIN